MITSSTDPPSDCRSYAYGRASTARQQNSLRVQQQQAEAAVAKEEDKDDTQQQREQFADRINRGDIPGRFDGFYCDTISSRKKPLFEREEFRIVWDKLRKGDHLLITAFDRVCRSLSEMATFIERLTEKGVLLHVLRFGDGECDLASPQGEMLIGVLAVCARFEQRMNSARVKETLAYLKSQGLQYHAAAEFGRKRIFGPRGTNGRRRIEQRVEHAGEMALIEQIYTRHHDRRDSLMSILNCFNGRCKPASECPWCEADGQRQRTAEGNFWYYSRVWKAYYWYAAKMEKSDV